MTQDERMDRMQREIDELRLAIAALRQRCDTYPKKYLAPWDEGLHRPWWSNGEWYC